jgi:DNA-binding MarR family transcriptional regulator
LERAGLVSRSRSAQTRPCKLETSTLEAAANWVEAYRSMWEASFDRLDTLLKTTKRSSSSKGKKHAAK